VKSVVDDSSRLLLLMLNSGMEVELRDLVDVVLVVVEGQAEKNKRKGRGISVHRSFLGPLTL
jgi:hypothetical protein